MTVDVGLESDVHRRVADRLAERIRVDETDALSEEDQRALSLELVSEELEALAAVAYSSGGHPLTDQEESELGEAVFARLWGLGRLQAIIDDPTVTNIHVNGYDHVWVTHRDGTKLAADPFVDSDRELVDLISTAARRLGRTEKRWDLASWELNLQLPGGERLHAVMGLTGRPVVSIRRHDFSISRLGHLVELGMLDKGLAEFLGAAVRARLNVVIAGATNTGKTTLLRCALNEVPAEERVITVEDNLEIGLEQFLDLHPDQVAWERRGANIEGRGEVTLAECVRATLRQSPDRVIVGEIRGVEVLDMLRAMSQGTEGSMSTIHADSSRNAVVRMEMYLLEAGLDEQTATKWIASAIDLVVHIGWVNGLRVITSVREVAGADDRLVATNEIFRPDGTGRAVPAPGPTIRNETLSRLVHAGFDSGLLSNSQGWWQ